MVATNTHGIWDEPSLRLIFSSVKNPRFKRHLTWKATPFSFKHDKVGGSSTIERIFYVFSKRLKIETEVMQRTSINVSSFCKDHHFGTEVCLQESRRTLTPKLVLLSLGIYHCDSLYPGNATKPPLFMVRSCKVSSGWYKRRLHSSEVLCLYDISDTVCHSLSAEMKSCILATTNLTPVRMLFAMLKTVLEGLPGWGVEVAERHIKQRAGDLPDLLSSKVLPGEHLQMVKEGKRDTQQEEATKDADAEIPYHLWDSRLKIIWACNELIKPHNNGMPQAAEVLRWRFYMRYWKMKVRTSFSQCF
jgi:hypothetical protein